MMTKPRLLVALLALHLLVAGALAEDRSFERVQLSDTFYSEGAHFADINDDGEMDIISGPFWWAGPDYEERHEYYAGEAYDPAGYSQHFFTFPYDFTGNGRVDILVIGFPGAEARWYENPGPDGLDEHWQMHIAYEGVDNESPTFTDITGDGKPEIVASTEGAFGYLQPDWDNPRDEWTFHEISPQGPAGGRFTHGLGVGDVNGDGRMDLLEKNGWWEQPESLEGDEHWEHHPFQFSEAGGAQMYAYDVNGDGKNDIITSMQAHSWGLAWFEQVEGDDGEITFKRHDIMTDSPDDSPYGIAISQLHAIELVDIDGDGLKDIVTGKRWWAHGGNDPGADDPSVVTWFELRRRDDGEIDWVPHEIDDDSGVGVQVVGGDVSGNGLTDVVVGNKRGTFVHLQRESGSSEVHPLNRGRAMFAGLEAEEAAEAMSVPDGFNVDLVAAEPDVHQPIAQAIDHRGRLWVAENYSYPRWGETGEDRILIFEDTTGDGEFDKRTVFYDKLNFVTGMEVGFGGVFVGSPPNLLYFEIDETGDQPAGEPEVLLDGWGHDDTHETLNSFVWGPDGWLYGLQGVFTHSNVGRPGTPEAQREPINAGVWRYHPKRREFEVFAHGTSNPWGVDFNDHGEAFMTACVIPHAWHVVQGARYHRQAGSHFNPYTYDDIKTIGDHAHYAGSITDHAWWGQKPEVPTDTLAAGGGHAHAGAMIYLGDNWPEKYRNTLFMNNLHGNRVNNDVLTPDGGSGFVASHADDFLLANDQWYRGLSLKYGPDGGVFIIDWYDEQACHHMDYDIWNRSVGRVYKVTYGEPEPVEIDLSKLSDAELVELQLHKNDWYVRQARMLLQQRGGSDAVHADLRDILKDHDDVTRRLRALWALHVTDGLDEATVLELLESDEPYLRGWAIKLTTEDRQISSAVHAKLSQMSHQERSPVVRRYLASALQRLDLHQRWDVAAGLIARSEDADDHNLPLLIWYGVEELVPEDPERAMELAAGSAIPQVQRYMIRRAATDVDRLGPVIGLLGSTEQAAEHRLILEEMVAAYEDQANLPMPEGWDEVYEQLMASDDAVVRDRAVFLAVRFGDERIFPHMRQVLGDDEAEMDERLQAMDLLLSGNDAEAVPILQDVLDEPALRGRAIRGLAAFNDPRTPEAILSHYDTFNAEHRDDAINTLASRPSYAVAMLDAMEDGDVDRGDLSAYVVRQMLEFDDEEIERKIADVWGQVRDVSADKQRQIDRYKELLDEETLAEADLSRGRQLYTQTCGACHKLFGAGGDIGPDITGSNRGDLDYVLRNIIDPNAEVGRDYQLATVRLNDGRIVSGMIRSETRTAVTVQTLNEREVVARDDIDSIDFAEISMMPEGLLMPLEDEQVRDMVAYLGSQSQVPLPHQRLTFDDDGTVPDAIEGEAMDVVETTRGDTQAQSMGGFPDDRWSGESQLWWTGGRVGDRLTLSFPVEEAGRYEVQMALTKAPDYAIVQLAIDGEKLGEPIDLYDESVVTTGLLVLGEREFEAGDHELSVEIIGANEEAIEQFMFGLDFLRLVPGVEVGL